MCLTAQLQCGWPRVGRAAGPSSIDWALLQGAPEWGVSILQAEAEMDSGDIWATNTFPTRAGRGPLPELGCRKLTNQGIRMGWRGIIIPRNP